ncbi:hypothetical protein [Variovorax soli]|nr:hypothetical protein [Variovorax soli]
MADSENKQEIEVSVWTDVADTSSKVASGRLKPSASSPGLSSLVGPLKCQLPSGLNVEVSCERIPTGEFHVGILHDGELASMGKYAGMLAVRMFPRAHSSYVVNIEVPGQRHGG